MATEAAPEEASDATFSESILGKKFFEDQSIRKWLSRPYSVVGLTAIFAALVFIPYLGAVGLWDPWETHYGEVARSMIQRNDYVHPYWESAPFYSKPVLTMWITALGMQLAGTNRTTLDEPLTLYTEWFMRMPFALMSIGALCLLAYALQRTVNRRTALASIFVMVTMPLYFLLTRQAVTDTPFLTTMIAAMACALIGQLDPDTQHRAAWWYAFWVLCALSTLAKELLGIAIPAGTLFFYACFSVIPWTRESLNAHVQWLMEPSVRAEVRAGKRPMPVLWAQFYKMKLGTGLATFALIALPWLIVMCFTDSVDDEGKTFVFRYFIHDQFARLTTGVHTTTPGGSFTYFIEQGGYAIFPWVALVPGAIGILSRLKLRSSDSKDHVAVIAAIWSTLTFGLIGASATKFHHYVFPMLPGLAILIGMFVDRLWKEGIKRNAGALMLGLPLFILVGKDLASNTKAFTDLFVYNYDRPYPWDLVNKPISVSAVRPLWIGDLVTLVLLALGAYLVYESFTDKSRPIFSRAIAVGMTLVGGATLWVEASQGRQSPLLFIGVAIILTALYLGYEAGRSPAEERNTLWGAAAVVGVLGLVCAVQGNRLPLNADPILPQLVQTVNIKYALGFVFLVAGVLLVFGMVMQQKTMVFGTFWALAAGFTLWFNWGHWVDLSHHWTQRDQYWAYYRLRKPDEPITAFLMNWRGETFYSKNTVKQIKENNRLALYAALPGRKWAQVEHNRFGILKSAAGADHPVTVVDKDLNNKFMLVTIE